MTTINLKDFYYWYTQDQFIEVSDEVAEVFVSDARHEMACLFLRACRFTCVESAAQKITIVFGQAK